MPKQTILLVDRETDFLEWAKHQLENENVRVLTETASDTAFKTFGIENPDLVLAELHLHPSSGLELLARIRKQSPNAMVIITCGTGSNQGVIESMKLGAFDFVRKEQLPFNLKLIVDSALKERAEMQAASPFKPVLTIDEHKDEIVGKSEAMQQVFKMIGRVAGSDAPVMITGESGSGKELVARAISRYSARSDRAFLAINCAAIPENLLEGLLFGTVKGAFTGAIDRPGLFERANGSTLFLDELLAMPLTLQAKLLRVLQEKKVARLGSDREIDLDIKIVSSVGKPPRDAIKEGELRVDLFYRLGVVMVKIPPLRDRQDDLGALVNHFLARLNATFGTQVQAVSPAVMELFVGYGWPGNVRELEHLLEGAMNIVGLGEQIDLKHFSASLDAFNVEADGAAPPSAPTESGRQPEPVAPRNEEGAPAQAAATAAKTLHEEQHHAEKAALQRALRQQGGNVSRAAAALGISRQLLTYKMKKHHLTRLDFLL